MDILIYILIIGLGVAAADRPSDDYDYGAAYQDEPEMEYSEETPAETPAETPYEEPEAEEPSNDFVSSTPPGFTPIAPPAEPEPEPVAEPEPAAEPLPDEPAYAAEDQTPTGRMTTAAEVRPILNATRNNWIAVRNYDGQDLLYFTNLLAWRCGLHEIRYRVNDGGEQVLAAEPCYLDEGAPNALKVQDVLPYVVLPPGSVETVHVWVLFDDLSVDSADYQRQMIEIN